MIFLRGDISDLVSDSDRYCTYTDDPDDVDIERDLQGVDDDEVEDVILGYLLCHYFFCFGWLTIDC